MTATNLRNGYHNFGHMFHVTFRCYEAIKYYGVTIGKRDARALLIAAMFHDFNHPGKTGNDDLNIIFALRGLNKHLLDEDRDLLPLIIEIIQATEFPYTVAGEKIAFLCQIIRDADISQVFSVSWIQTFAFGLSGEMGVCPKRMLEMQEGYLTSLRFLTAWGKATFPQNVIDTKIMEVKTLLACLD